MARSKYTEVELGIIQDISNNLKRILHLKGISQTELSGKTGLSTSTISDYVLGKTLMSPGNLQKISEALNVLTIDIKPNGDRLLSKMIPLVGTICAGDGLLAEQNIEDYVQYPFKKGQQPDYALRVKGDSMVDAGINSGDIIYLRYAQWADYNGQIVAALINDNQEGLLKRMKWIEGDPLIRLLPENKDFKVITVLPNQLTICGVYMGHFSPEKKEQ